MLPKLTEIKILLIKNVQKGSHSVLLDDEKSLEMLSQSENED